MEISSIGNSRDVQNPTQNSKPKSESKPESKSEDSPASEVYITNTDKVDREIEELKSKLQRATSEDEIAKIENELRLKDNDSYRKQHSEHFSRIERRRVANSQL